MLNMEKGRDMEYLVKKINQLPRLDSIGGQQELENGYLIPIGFEGRSTTIALNVHELRDSVDYLSSDIFDSKYLAKTDRNGTMSADDKEKLNSISSQAINHLSEIALNISDGSSQGSLKAIGATQQDENYSIGKYSFAGGQGTVADQNNQTAIGKFNIRGNENNLFVIGNGTSDEARSDAFTVDQNGNVTISGDVNLTEGANYKINGSTINAAFFNAVPTSRTINGHTLSQDVTITASDIIDAVPTSRTVNNNQLDRDITLTAIDVGAVPITRTINNNQLNNDIILTATDVGAVPASDVSTNGGANKVMKTDGSGDLTTGLLKVTKNGNTVTIGSQDSTSCLIQNNTNIPFKFNKTILPSSHNSIDLGSNGLKWKDLYLGGNIIADAGKFSVGNNLTQVKTLDADGQILTSFKDSVAMGSYYCQATTIPNFVKDIRYSSGCAGSVKIRTSYTKNNVTIPGDDSTSSSGIWYNYMYMPHRTGGLNGSAVSDNCNYGNILLCGMSGSNEKFFISIDGGIINQVSKIYTSLNVSSLETTQWQNLSIRTEYFNTSFEESVYRYRKINGFVEIQLCLKPKNYGTNSYDNVLVTTVPTGFRPQTPAAIPFNVATYNTSADCFFRVYSDGKIFCQLTASEGELDPPHFNTLIYAHALYSPE